MCRRVFKWFSIPRITHVMLPLGFGKCLELDDIFYPTFGDWGVQYSSRIWHPYFLPFRT